MTVTTCTMEQRALKTSPSATALRVSQERARPQPWMLEIYGPQTRGSVGDLSDVGRLAYLLFAKQAADVTALAEELFREGRRTAEETLLQEAHAVGCPVLSVNLSSGALLSWIRDRADWAGQKVCDTYNAELVNEILRVCSKTPTANRWVLANDIQAWDWARQHLYKAEQIGTTEAFVIANDVRMRFYAINTVKEPEAWFGYSLQCEICQRIAARNPYTIREADAIGLPHVGCLDQWHFRGGEAVACDELWLGE